MTRPIGCRDAIERLWVYLDGGLDPARSDELEAHLTWCMQCCGELEFARHLRRFLRERATPRMPGDVAARLHRAVDELPVPERRLPLDPDRTHDPHNTLGPDGTLGPDDTR